METHALALIELYIELQTKQVELGRNIEKALGLNKGEVSPVLLDSSIGKVEMLILDAIEEIADEVRSDIWDNGILYSFYLKIGNDAQKILGAIKNHKTE